MFKDRVFQYYHIPDCSNQKKRDLFTSYGTCGAINVEVDEAPLDCELESNKEQNCFSNNNIGERVKFICQTIRDRSDGRFELMARNPSLPLMPPNHCKCLHFQLFSCRWRGFVNYVSG
jgi:hypothetical protein